MSASARIGEVMENNMTTGVRPSEQRYCALDALRAFVLLLGVVYHAALSFVLPPDGVWAVGTSDTSMPLWWFIYYAHAFRMEVFFLLAGFFACLVVEKRGTAAFLRNRAKRIVLVFIVAVYPMAFLFSMIWIEGGLKTGWLQLPAEIAALPLWRIAHGGMQLGPWYDISLGHLWFLYYLAWISGLFLLLRCLLLRASGDAAQLLQGLDYLFHRAFSSRLAPVWIALLVLPWLAAMPRYDVDSPVKGLLLRFPALLIYGLFFTMGWWLRRQPQLLEIFARRWKPLLGTGLLMSILAWGGDWLRIFGQPSETVAWAARFSVCLTMGLSVLGWLGLFVSVFNRPSARARYLADSSYWVYLAHLPIVVALQVWLVAWDSVWIKLLAINTISFALLFASYHGLVRYSWVGRWLNGPRHKLSANFKNSLAQ